MSDPIADAARRLTAEPAYRHTEHLLVSRHGEVIAAHALHDRPLDRPGCIYSVTKSVIATLVGAALVDGLLPSLDTTIGDLLGDRVPAPRAPATVRHLLSMTGGAHCTGVEAIDAVMELPGSWVDRLLREPQQHPPGTVFSYDNGAVQILTAALAAAVGDVEEYAARRIFAPLGITTWTWPRDPDGVPDGFGGLHLAPLDLGKLGELWRTGGLGLAGFLAQATRPHVTGGAPEDRQYGWLFWIDRVAGRPAFFAGGYAGQHVLVVPSAGLTVVTTGAEARLEPGWRPAIEVSRDLVAQLVRG